MDYKMQVEGLSSTMLMNICIKIKKGIKLFGSKLFTALYTKHKVCTLLIS